MDICTLQYYNLYLLYILNILSIITGFKFIIHLYDIIAGDNVFKPFMSDNYQTFLNMTEEVSENLPDINDSNEIIIDPKEILEKNSRIILIKIILLIISGFSYINGSIIPFLNFLKGDEITFRMLSNGIINPVGGMFISSVLYFNKDYKMFIISLIIFTWNNINVLSIYFRFRNIFNDNT